MSIELSTKIESATAILGAAIAAAGAIWLNPVLVAIGVVAATAATIFRVSESHRLRAPTVVNPPGSAKQHF